MISEEQRRELAGLGLLALALFMLLSLVPANVLGGLGERLGSSQNLLGPAGAGFARGVVGAFGIGAPVLALVAALGGAVAFGWIERGRGLRWGTLGLGLALVLPTGAMLLAPDVLAPAGVVRPEAAGWLGGVVGALLAAGLGWLGAVLLLLFVTLGLCVATLGWNPARSAARAVASAVRRTGPDSGTAVTHAARGFAPPTEELLPEIELDSEAALATADASATGLLRRRRRSRLRETELEDTGRPESDDLPPIDLLTPQPARDASMAEGELDRLGAVLIDTLKTFRVEGQIGGRTTGPVVTQYEVVPAPGVKVNRIANLDADLALALKAPSVRIVAPIPGKGAVGVEVPNPVAEVVQLREIVEAPAFRRSRGLLPLALGKDLTGNPYVSDLTRMPHVLIAGATGSGKSVCINTIITSLVYRHSPRSLRLLMIDPKMVELSMYGDLPHLRHPVVTDPKDAAVVLRWAVLEMERRYGLIAENGARSVSEFNRRVEERRVLRWPAEEDDADDVADSDAARAYDGGPLPFIVLIIDELADLMMSVQSEIERPLAQLAQKARAIGIHLIVATQRPSVNVITGLIKANFPCRIAFRVASKVDSRTILDQNGADALLGNGDMLFLPPGRSDPVRVQGAYISTDDTEALMEWYRAREQAPAAAEEDILEVVRAREAAEADELPEDLVAERDPLFQQAAEICVQFQQGSTSLLQRRLRIGYGRAARIIDQLHAAGVLGPPDGSKPREVLVGLE